MSQQILAYGMLAIASLLVVAAWWANGHHAVTESQKEAECLRAMRTQNKQTPSAEPRQTESTRPRGHSEEVTTWNEE